MTNTAASGPARSTRGPWMVMSNNNGTVWQVARKVETGNWATTSLEWMLDQRGRPARFKTEAEAKAARETLPE